jgi:hypothetical protein
MAYFIRVHKDNRFEQIEITDFQQPDIQDMIEIIENLNATDSMFIGTDVDKRRTKSHDWSLGVFGGYPERVSDICMQEDEQGGNLKDARLLDPSLGLDDGEIEMGVAGSRDIDSHPIYKTVTKDVAIKVVEAYLTTQELPAGYTWLDLGTKETWVS